MVRLFAISADPDTEKAKILLKQANIEYHLVDVEREGVLGFLDRDLDVRDLPFILVAGGKIEGIEAIKGFVALSK